MYGLNIYNIDLDKRTCVANVDIKGHLSVEDFIAAVRSAAEGLTDSTVETRGDVEYGDPVGEVYVSGTRPLTDEEYKMIKADRERHKRLQAHMAKFEG